MRLILIRHGQTDHNLQKRYCGSNDPALNNSGVHQAQMLRERLKGEKVGKVYSSSQKRAYQTAEIIFPDREIEKRDGLAEMSFGIFEGMAYDEIMAKYANIYTDWLRNPFQARIPQAEQLESLYARVRSEIDFIFSRSGENETIAVIAHGGPNRVILCDAYGYSSEKFWEIEQDNGALNIIEYTSLTSAKVVIINDTVHLPEESNKL
ncbi:MAG: histidine phosphatase family protein [Candidatus Omnitrophota bacterium]|nr:histidine phosphatase family protein [Candidatus Omnitrophota bacterium]